jgi:excisionase family DNA binding protein
VQQISLNVTVTIDPETIHQLAQSLADALPSAASPPAAEDRRLLDAAEAADLLGISKGKLYELVREGGGPPVVRIGRRLRWRRSDIDAWVDEVKGRPSERRY